MTSDRRSASTSVCEVEAEALESEIIELIHGLDDCDFPLQRPRAQKLVN